MADTQNTAEPCGILPIDKPAGKTSHDIVGQMRRLFHTKRVGHTGTLDPMATGVLTILIGRAAKAAEYLVCDRKTYVAELRLGLTTDTEDTTGRVLTECRDLPASDAVFAAARSFLGTYAQIPPMVSALKVGGKKLVDLARQGIEIERKPRDVMIFALDCRATDRADTYVLTVECSSGTYIRTLCADIGKKLGCGGVMAALRRTAAGGYTLADCRPPAEVEAVEEAERPALLLPVETLFSSLFAVRLPAFYEKLARSGCEIYQKKIGTDYPVGTRVRVCDESGKFFALGEVREYPDGSAVKLIKIFEL